MKTEEDSLPLIFLKLLHTVVWAFFAGCILFILYRGFFGPIDIWVWGAIFMVLIEAFVLLINKWSCPITPIARKYTDSQKENFDIYLPEWLAKHNKSIFTALYIFGLVLFFLRYFNFFS
jgi:hypothetical protein